MSKPPKYLYWHTGCGSVDTKPCSNLNSCEDDNCKALKYEREVNKMEKVTHCLYHKFVDTTQRGVCDICELEEYVRNRIVEVEKRIEELEKSDSYARAANYIDCVKAGIFERLEDLEKQLNPNPYNEPEIPGKCNHEYTIGGSGLMPTICGKCGHKLGEPEKPKKVKETCQVFFSVQSIFDHYYPESFIVSDNITKQECIRNHQKLIKGQIIDNIRQLAIEKVNKVYSQSSSDSRHQLYIGIRKALEEL